MARKVPSDRPMLFRFPRIRPSTLLIALAVTAGAIGISLALFAGRVFALRDQRAAGPNWSFPSRMYSSGVPLVEGTTVPDIYLRSQLAARGYLEERSLSLTPGRYTYSGHRFEIVLRGFSDPPDPEGSGGPEHVVVTTDGGSIVQVERIGGIGHSPRPDLAHPPRLEPVLVSMLFDDDLMWRMRVPLERIPLAVRRAIVTSEDRRFYSHPGLDVRGIARAFAMNMKKGSTRQGGSTITQQLARGLFLGRERTWFRKLAEVPLALGLEVVLSKDEILEMYLNSVYWGQAGAYSIGGIASAAQWYFDVPVESLSVVQGAMLASMIPAPNVHTPFENPEPVRLRRNTVLEELERVGHLRPGESARLGQTPLGLRRGTTPAERFPSYAGYVNHVLDQLIRPRAGTHFGLSIFTTMDLAWQELAEDAMESGLAKLDPGRRRDRLEGAFVALDPSRSSVLAMVGGRTSETGHFNRAYQARRQPGSAIKPFVYAAAFASGRGITPATTVADTQVTYGRGRQAWRPRNFDGTYHPEVTLAKALEKSLNVATTSLVEMIGPHAVVDVAERFGLGRLKPVLSIGLGSNEVTLLDLTNAYAAFQTAGMLHHPSPLRLVLNRRGVRVAGPSLEATQAIPPGIAALMTGLLQNIVRYGVASPLRTVYGMARPLGGKTGTSNDFHDAWFVGITPHVVGGVWVGYDRPRSIGRAAAHSAIPLWARTVGRMLEGFPPAPFLDASHLEWADMNPWSGCLADSAGTGELTPFLPGTAPLSTCVPYESFDYETAYGDSAYPEDSLWIVDDTEHDSTTFEYTAEDTSTYAPRPE